MDTALFSHFFLDDDRTARTFVQFWKFIFKNMENTNFEDRKNTNFTFFTKYKNSTFGFLPTPKNSTFHFLPTPKVSRYPILPTPKVSRYPFFAPPNVSTFQKTQNKSHPKSHKSLGCGVVVMRGVAPTPHYPPKLQ